MIVKISGGSNGTYRYHENTEETISEYAGYWYASQLLTRYGSCLVVYKNKAIANERIKVTIRYIKIAVHKIAEKIFNDKN